ncbi:phosphate ABC transporter permease subunit PstC [Celeribacter neptunius]|uniref:Phosphate transport system permease protein n=1 Tax=Celeribacter neptunius TaxID=588602 RepID=A0A1I3L0T7_9RHOB|nr:phosphate ABC transporter permease subunit PstC [Celeribacter neptunius]SFI78359.1 phosphate ABC transporter membrane protein 1, PhoT family [Celeribacter neptunius]
MPILWLILLVLALGLIGFVLGRSRALSNAGGDIRQLHSLPSYYGSNVLLATLIPGLAVLLLWLIAQPMVIHGQISSMIPESAYTDAGSLNLVMSDVKRVAEGLDIAVQEGALSVEQARDIRTEFTDIRARLGEVGVALGSNVEAYVLKAAQRYRVMNAVGHWIMTGAVLAAALAGFAYALMRTNKDYRARNQVEKVLLGLLIGAASLAVLTTVGIVLSLIFNTIEFFKLYPAMDFFFGTTWSPSFGGGSELGILPLFWGTFYVSLIALVVAVPIGLFAAVYLSEYAGPKVRAIAKPLLEVLAGIPTIVYGLFALLTVGPLLMNVFGEDGGLGWMQGGRSVMTAGLVMGVMLIPFVSSLSDDIINAVPQAMRDGSLGLGATKSETVKQVVLPAALPGIVGAILLAASRAIGETMIVVLGAGAAARLSMNPFEAMTTVTTRIVSQLTGDADFASAEALVAFALGMTLFVITLGLNILALVIVRKYREQYD